MTYRHAKDLVLSVNLQNEEIAPYFDEKGLHFPNLLDDLLVDQYIPKKIIFEAIDAYMKEKEVK